MRQITIVLGLAMAVGLAARTSAPAAPAKPEAVLPAERALDMDYGPFLSASVMRKNTAPPGAEAKPRKSDPAPRKAAPPEAVALKGIAIRLYDDKGQFKAAVCFDTDRLCIAQGWTGGFIETAGTMLTNHKGNGYTTVAGTESFRQDGLGWGTGEQGGDFTDPRPGGLGPLPAERGRYRGLYLHGNQVVLSYQVAGSDVLELPGYEAAPDGSAVFTRTIRIERSTGPLSLAVSDIDDKHHSQRGIPDANGLILRGKEGAYSFALSSAPKGAVFQCVDGRLRLELPKLDFAAVFKVSIWKNADDKALESYGKTSPAPIDPRTLCSGGPAHWTQPVTTAGHPGSQTAAGSAFKKFPYVLDTLDIPDANPWHSWMRLTGLDFFADGRAAVCTFNGDVWIASGIDEKLATLTWKRFATGLYQPLGLKVSGGDVYVLGRDQITRLHDLNGDGEADYYEDFNSGGIVHPMYNTFAFDLQQGSDGSFYYSRGGHMLSANYPGHGYAFRVSSDGSKLEPIAAGLRAANGLGAGADDRVLVSDNEGEWTPASRINMLRMPRPGEPLDFFGFVPQSHRDQPPTDYDRPLCWVPHRIDTSSGGQAYIADDRWGPYKGQWVHTSYGTSSLFLLLADESSGRAPGLVQGAVIKFPLAFDTGIMRPRFNPADGQLFVAGIGGGWQTSGTRDGGLYRIRFTGGPPPPYFPTAFHVLPHAIQFTFAAPLDRTSAADEQSWAAEQWNYRWEAKYGSPDLSVKDPRKNGHDPVDIKSVTVSPDGKTVTLGIPELAPVMQMMIQPSLKAADGTPVEWECYLTVNHVP
jgi:hypothetical protein